MPKMKTKAGAKKRFKFLQEQENLKESMLLKVIS